jgi:hypothetical protein
LIRFGARQRSRPRPLPSGSFLRSTLVAVGEELAAPLDEHRPPHACGESAADRFGFLVGEHERGLGMTPAQEVRPRRPPISKSVLKLRALSHRPTIPVVMGNFVSAQDQATGQVSLPAASQLTVRDAELLEERPENA